MRSAMKIYVVVALLVAWTSAGKICQKCKCRNDSVVDCTNLGLDNHFEDTDWNDTRTEIGLLSVFFDNNELVHVLPFPALPIEKLTLTHNRISKIEDFSFRDLQNLTELDLSHNHLTSDILQPPVFQGRYAEDSYQPLRNLKILRLGSNALHSLSADLFEHFPKLEELYLDSNPLKILDRVTIIAIVTPAYLKVLDLSYTDINELPDHMLHTTRFLQDLNLKGNRFTRVPKDLAEAVNLKKLNFDDNPIQAITTSRPFPQMDNLTSLRLNWMPNLTRIEAGAFGALPKLEEFICSHNMLLDTIDAAAFSKMRDGDEGLTAVPIKKLELHHNNLGYLDSSLIARWDQVEVIDLQFNPWVCDCENQWLVSTLAKIIEVDHAENMQDFKCEEPVEMRGQDIAHLAAKGYEMRCADLDGNHPEGDGHMLIGVLIGTLLAVPVTIALLMAWRRYRHLMSTNRRPAEYSRAFYAKAENSDEF